MNAVPDWFSFVLFARWAKARRKDRKMAAKFPKESTTDRGFSEKTYKSIEAYCKKPESPRPSFDADSILAIARYLDPYADSFEAIRLLYADVPFLYVEEAPTLICDGYEIPGCIPELDFTSQGGLLAEDLAFEVLPESHVPMDAGLQTHKDDYLARRIAGAKATRPLSNDPSFALVEIMEKSVERPSIGGPSHALDGVAINRSRSGGNWHCTYTLQVRPCNYFDFIWPNTCLDDAIIHDGKPTTLREVFNLRSPRLKGIGKLPGVTPRLGSNVAVVTKDKKIVVTVRSPDTAIAPGGYHGAVAEGFLSSDVTAGGCPFAVAKRGLAHELGLEVGHHYHTSDLICLGLVLDTQRMQPMLFFYLNASALKFAEVCAQWKSARDRPENLNLIAVDWLPANASQLARGSIPGMKRSTWGMPEPAVLKVASNHAQAGFALAALHDFPWLRDTPSQSRLPLAQP